MTMDNRKEKILKFISENPGVRSHNIDVGLGRASVGAHLRALMNTGMLIQDSSDGWHVAENYVVSMPPKAITPMDIAAECIRKMIDVNKR